MRWGRAKTILIVMFLMIDIFLFALLIYTESSENNISDKNIYETVQVLNNYGIKIKDSTIPKERHKNISLTMQNNFSDAKDAAEMFLGKGYTEKSVYETRHEYVKEESTLIVDKNNFTYRNSRLGETAQNEGDALKALKKEMKKMGAKPDDYKFELISAENGIYKFNAFALYDGIKISGNDIIVYADKKGITEMNGTLLLVTEAKPVYGKLKDVTAVLCSIIYDESFRDTAIENVEFTYYINPNDVRENILADPAYLITASNGEKHYITDIIED